MAYQTFFTKTINATTSNGFTSALMVQPGGHLNVSVRGSGGSTTITLLRQLPNDTTVSALSGLAEMYRLVQQWDITSLSNTDLGPTSNIELITEHPEPERTKYVLGILSGDYGSGVWYLRVGSEKADPWSIA